MLLHPPLLNVQVLNSIFIIPLQKIILSIKLFSYVNKGVQSRSCLASSFVSCGEPTRVEEALNDLDWVNAMHEGLNNFACDEVWELLRRPSDHNVIGTKWVFRNK
jgi:hypothetical protein